MGLAQCRPAPACAQLAKQPQQEASFVIDLLAHGNTAGPDGTAPAFPEAERLANWTCLANLLRARGAEVEPQGESFDVFATATWSQVQDLLRLELVNTVEVGCRTQDVCTHCDALSVAACANDALCSVISAAPIDGAGMCAQMPVPVGCMPSGRPCGEAISFAADPEGRCWQFGTTCIPEGWQGDAMCRPDDAGQFPACK